MEQQNKYYTPDISELHIGYECQLFVPKSTDPFVLGGYYDVWVQMSFTKPWRIADVQKGESQVRTKYLDQSDIESCGWIKDWDEDSNYTGCYKLLIKSDIIGQSEDNWELWHYDKIVSINNELSNRCFDGFCPSINELRTIMKFLKITEDGKS